MKDSYVGKTFLNEANEEFIVLSELEYKNIDCVYTMKVMPNDEEGEKKFFQIVQDKDGFKLVNIKSKKMVMEVYNVLFGKKEKELPRKINESESIEEYFMYLDKFYESKVIAII